MTDTKLMQMAEAARQYYVDLSYQDIRPAPFFVFRTAHDKVFHLPSPFDDDATRQDMMTILMAAFAFWEVVEYVAAFESWIVDKAYDSPDVLYAEAEKVTPSTHPDRQSALVISGKNHKTQISGVAKAALDGNIIAIGDIEWFDGDAVIASGAMMRMLPPKELGTPPPRAKKFFFDNFPQLNGLCKEWVLEDQTSEKEN